MAASDVDQHDVPDAVNRIVQVGNRHPLVVGISARISGSANQKVLSLEDQIDHGNDVVTDMYDG